MPGIGIGLGLTLGGGGGALTDTAIARALLAKGLSDAQARATVGGATSLGAGLRAVGLMPAAATPAPAPAPTPTPSPAPTPTPTPSFTEDPAITPAKGVVGQQFTAQDGTVKNGSVVSRRWLLNGAVIGTGVVVIPAAVGTLILENTASGPGGTQTAVSLAANVANFTKNGSTNNILKAMLTDKSGIIVEKGDSVTAGVGSPVTENKSSSSYAQQGNSARSYRNSNTIAASMTSAGYPAFDNAFIGDQHLTDPGNGISVATYDPRVGGSIWSVNTSQDFAGGCYFQDNQGRAMTFTPTNGVDTFEVWAYNIGGTIAFTIDGAAPSNIVAPGCTISGNNVTIPNPGTGGISRITITSSSLGSHTLGFSSSSDAAIRGARGYNSAALGIHFLNHSAGSARSDQQAATAPSGWGNLDAIAFDAPKLTIVRVGLNDAAQNTGTANYQTNLQAIVTAAKNAGSDVLVLWSNAASPTGFSPTATQDAYHDICQQVAASSGVAFGDIRAAMGDWANTGGRTADGIVHPNRGYHADIGAYIWSCIQAMAA